MLNIFSNSDHPILFKSIFQTIFQFFFLRLPAFPGVLAVVKSDNHLPSSNIQVSCASFLKFSTFLTINSRFYSAVLCINAFLLPCFIQAKNIAGYAVGEYVENLDAENTDQPEKLTENPDFYEIVTAWVHPE